MHEKILDKFRALKTHLKKVAKLKARGESTRLKILRKSKPAYSVNHLVKERYTHTLTMNVYFLTFF